VPEHSISLPDSVVTCDHRPMEDVETERLLLRRWQRNDLDVLARLFAKPEMWWWPFKRGRTTEETDEFLERKLHEWDDRGWSQWAAVEKRSGTLIGFIGLCPPASLPEVMPAVEVGWRLDPDVWGQGYATEGGRAAIDAGFNILGLDEIVSIYEPDNVASGRVMQRLGMTHDRDTTHPTLGVPLRIYRIGIEAWRS
jgi:RimJ/RimL family protein N-acetyltransferase